jgi:hypothetical protein
MVHKAKEERLEVPEGYFVDEEHDGFYPGDIKESGERHRFIQGGDVHYGEQKRCASWNSAVKCIQVRIRTEENFNARLNERIKYNRLKR